MRQQLPGWLQGPLTYVTGKAYRGQPQQFKRTPLDHLAVAPALLTAGVGFGVVAFEAGLVYWVLLLPCYVLTVGGARRLQIDIVHACVHYRFFRVGWANVLLGEAASILVLTQDFQAYRCDHVFHRHGKGIATIDDPDMLLLYDLGIRPGLPKSLLGVDC